MTQVIINWPRVLIFVNLDPKFFGVRNLLQHFPLEFSGPNVFVIYRIKAQHLRYILESKKIKIHVITTESGTKKKHFCKISFPRCDFSHMQMKEREIVRAHEQIRE